MSQSQEPKPPIVHPDFDDAAADVIIISGDDSHTHFRIASSHLSRTSEFFHGMFALPLGGVPPESRIALDDDAVILEILLKLATGVPGGLRRLLSTDDVERTLAAAEKYGMKGVEEILALYLRAPYLDWEPIRAYALASHWTGHAFTGEYYRAINKPEREYACTCGVPLQTRNHLLVGCPDLERYRAPLYEISPMLVVADLLGTREGLAATAKFIRASGAFSKPPGEDAAPADD